MTTLTKAQLNEIISKLTANKAFQESVDPFNLYLALEFVRKSVYMMFNVDVRREELESIIRVSTQNAFYTTYF